jgi:hypothetical protein
MPVLWLCGPPGVGKSTVGWEIFSELDRDGVPVGYVDIDQLGMCYGPPRPDQLFPEPDDDFGRHRMKARNLAGVVDAFRAAGARGVVVSGVVDAARGVDADVVPRAEFTVCRLRADPDELRARLVRRGERPERLDEELRAGVLLDRSGFADLCVDTTGRSAAEVVRAVRGATAGWPRPVIPTRPTAAPPAVGTPGRVLWVCGVTGAGKSNAGWHVLTGSLRAGIHTAFVDLEQIGFCRPAVAGDPLDHRVTARVLAGMWRTYHAAGARRLVVVGPLGRAGDVRIYTDALPHADVTVFRLHAGRDELRRRIALRGRGAGPNLAGNRLVGQPDGVLRRIADEAARQEQALDRAAIGDVRIDTDGRTLDEVAGMILAAADR